MAKDLVQFIGVGAPKCGTEWLTARLRAHPDIDFSKHKETNFFMTVKHGFNKFVYDNMRIKSWDEYEKQFSWDKDKIRGEFSNHYLFDVKALEKIKETFPNVKIIIAIRDPVKYLYSLFWYMKYSNVYNKLPETFKEGIETCREEELFHKDKGKFSVYVQKCFELFGKQNVFVVTLFDIAERPNEIIKELYRFLGVDPNFTPENISSHKNPTRQLRYPKLMKYVNYLIGLMVSLGMNKAINYFMNTDNPVRLFYKKIFHRNNKYPTIDKAYELELRSYFKEDVENLEKLLDRDLSNWKKGSS